MTPGSLTEHCTENAHLYPSAAACLKQKQTEYGTKVFRATADCTLGRITTTGEQTYTLDGLWDKSDIGGGRTRWRDVEGNVIGRDLINNGLHVSQQWEVLCPGAVTPALLARAAKAAQPAAVRTPPRPPVCVHQAFCTEVNDFAVIVSDFRASLTQPRKTLTATLTFQNKTDRPLVLGYVPRSGTAADERNNAYAAYDPDTRGIGLINTNAVDDKFVLQPGQSSDARLTYYWDAGRTVYGTSFRIELTAREILPLANGQQVQLGPEYPLRVEGLTHGARGGATSTSAAPRGVTGSAAAAPAAGAAPAAAAAPAIDRCAAASRPCYDAGPFTVTLNDLVGTIVGNRHHNLRLTLAITNNSDQPLILAYKASTSGAVDNAGNAYGWGRPGTVDGSTQGIGKVDSRSADTQFRLAPGASRNALFNVVRYNAPKPQGTSFTFDTVLVELRVLPNGTQTESVREYTIHLPDLAPGGRRAGNPASVDDLKKAGDVIRGIFGGKK
jgi:hypothetical protein